MQSKVIKDITKHRANFVMGMTIRQTVFAISGILVIVLGYVFLPIPNVLSMLLGFPLFVIGFYRPEGMNCEKYLMYWFESKFLLPRKRYYKAENKVYACLWKNTINGKRLSTRRKGNRDEKTETGFK